MKKLNLTAVAVVLGLALLVPAVADTLKAPTPVKPAQPAAKTPVTPATPKAAPCVDDGRGAPCSDSPMQTEISGHLRGCGAAPGEISITVNGTRSDKARVFQGSGGLQYKITGLSAGTKQIAPRSSTGACSTGTWEPASRTVVLRGRDDVHSNQDFSYRPPLPDLVPGVEVGASLNTMRIALYNRGTADAGPSILRVRCGAWGGIGNSVCPPFRGSDPASPNELVIRVPAVYLIGAPPKFSLYNLNTCWQAGNYRIHAKADAAHSVSESNEANNDAVRTFELRTPISCPPVAPAAPQPRSK